MTEETKRAWIEEQLKKAPPIDWDAWEASMVILGVKVKRRTAT